MKIGVILGSTRQGRSGERVAKWAFRRLSLQPDVEATLLDLRDYPLPFYEEAEIPSKIAGDYVNPAANRWRDAIAGLDGFIIVTAEYNHGVPAALKNALDYLYAPWNDKPALLVSYSSGPIGGARVVEQLRLVAPNLKLVALSEALHLGKVTELLTEAGEVISGPFDQLLDKNLATLTEWTGMLNKKRAGEA